MATAPETVKRLVDRFDQDRKVLLSGGYREEQLRAEFLNPFFTALGWDMDNKQGLSETFKQVIHEESIKACPERNRRVAGASKVPGDTGTRYLSQSGRRAGGRIPGSQIGQKNRRFSDSLQLSITSLPLGG